MTKDTRKFVSVCSVCARGKSFHQPSAGLLRPLFIPRCPWSHISLDLVSGLIPFTVTLSYLKSLIVSQSLSTTCLYRSYPLLRKLPTYSSVTFLDYGIPQDSVLEDLSLHHRFGGNSVSQWVQPLFVVPLLTTLFTPHSMH